MLKVLIVDDDIFVYTNLKKLINWEDEGFILCGKAGNGSEAVQMIKEELPDVVITDMNMPEMDGVEVITHIQQTYPHVKVIALSAYDDFKYVKESLKMGAVDYILKHTLSPEVLLAILRTTRESIIKEKEKEVISQEVAEQIRTGKSVLRRNFLTMLVREGISNREEIERKLAALDLELDTGNLVVVAGEIDDYLALKEKFGAGELSNMINSFMEMATEILKDTGKAIISDLEEGKFVIIFSFAGFRSDMHIYNQVLTAVTRIKSTIRRYLNITACFSIGEIRHNIAEVHDSYKKAERLLKEKFYEGKDRIFHVTNIRETTDNYKNLEIKEEKTLTRLIKSFERDKMRGYLEEIFARIQRSRPEPGATKLMLVGLINIVNRIARESGIDIARVYSQTMDPYEQLEKFDTMQDVKNWIVDLYNRLIDVLELYCINPEYDEVMKKAVEFICKNFNKNISLSDVAAYTGVNSSYLSRKFKNCCGKGFVEYLNGVRIAYAKRLIENGCTNVKKIIQEVGFNNYNYFFKVFKDSQGMTPHEYGESFR